MQQKIYTIEEAARILQLHPKTVRRKIQEGEIEALRVGRQYRISQKQMDELCGQKAVPEDASKSTPQPVLVSSLIDVDGISPEESMRFTNTIIAVMNSGPTHTRVNCIYYKETGKFKIIVNGEIDSMPEILTMIRELLKTRAGG